MPMLRTVFFSLQASLQPMHNPGLQHPLSSPCSLYPLSSLPFQASSGLPWALLVASVLTYSAAQGARKQNTFLRLHRALLPQPAPETRARQAVLLLVGFQSCSSAPGPGLVLPFLSSMASWFLWDMAGNLVFISLRNFTFYSIRRPEPAGLSVSIPCQERCWELLEPAVPSEAGLVALGDGKASDD